MNLFWLYIVYKKKKQQNVIYNNKMLEVFKKNHNDKTVYLKCIDCTIQYDYKKNVHFLAYKL